MKKSELTQLTQIIEHIVAKEVRKQLPTIISETFQNMMGKPVISERQVPVETPQRREYIGEQIDQPLENTSDFKASLRELFAGTPVMKTPQAPAQQRKTIQFTKDPKLNAILNETVSDLGNRERLVSAAAFQGGYSPSLSMVPGFNPAAAMMASEESPDPSFMRGVPSLAPTGAPMPMARPPVLREGQESTHIPASAIPEGVSALDVARQVPLAQPVAQALTRNYSQMMKLIDKKRGKA